MKIISRQFIYAPGTVTPQCHASTHCRLPDGRIMAAWFGGEHEKANDVEIWASYLENGRWSEPFVMSEITDRACWNPVLYADGSNVTLYFKRSKRISSWKTYVRRSCDGGVTWSDEEELCQGDESGGRGCVKNPPIKLRDGRLLEGASHESEDGKIWRAFFDISSDGGLTRERTDYIKCDTGLIQPTMWEDDSGIHAFFRSNGGFIYRADSDDAVHWSDAYRTVLPNNNSGICIAQNDGRQYLAYNPVGSDWGARTPLTVSELTDGGSPVRVCDLEREPGEYSYPTITAHDGILSVTYTWKRRTVVYAEIG